jgi:16S rRNA G966 N2-methylase RsmD
MQNRYVGDIGDYSKFVLINNLFNDKKVGIIWYLYPNEGNGDGKFRNYEKYNLKDKEIVEIMKKFSKIEEDKRNIQELENELKNNGFNYFNECIDKDCNSFFSNYKKREDYRKKWFKKALEQVKDCDVVFADPDNGTQIKVYSEKTHAKQKIKNGKYIFFDEIDKLLENHKIVVIYQHLIRDKNKHKIFIDKKERELKDKNLIKNNYNFFYTIKFKSDRVYLILSKENLKGKIEEFCNKFKGEFELIKES